MEEGLKDFNQERDSVLCSRKTALVAKCMTKREGIPRKPCLQSVHTWGPGQIGCSGRGIRGNEQDGESRFMSGS